MNNISDNISEEEMVERLTQEIERLFNEIQIEEFEYKNKMMNKLVTLEMLREKLGVLRIEINSR